MYRRLPESGFATCKTPKRFGMISRRLDGRAGFDSRRGASKLPPGWTMRRIMDEEIQYLRVALGGPLWFWEED